MEANQLIRQIDASSTPADAMELLAWSKAMLGKIDRGDMALGLVSIEQARMVPVALRKALDLGAAQAGLHLAEWLGWPPLGEVDLPAAEAVLLETIALGMEEACLPLMEYRWRYRRDSCTDQEARQAFLLLEKWCAKHPEHDEALYLLGIVSCYGFGTSVDPGQSARLLDMAARLGNADAMFELFLYHVNGTGVAQDEALAIAFLYRAAEAGQTRAMYNLGAFHATGRYVALDPALAVDWYTKAAYAGHAKAAETLATMYEHGFGVAQDDALAQRFRDMVE